MQSLQFRVSFLAGLQFINKMYVLYFMKMDIISMSILFIWSFGNIKNYIKPIAMLKVLIIKNEKLHVK